MWAMDKENIKKWAKILGIVEHNYAIDKSLLYYVSCGNVIGDLYKGIELI